MAAGHVYKTAQRRVAVLPKGPEWTDSAFSYKMSTEKHSSHLSDAIGETDHAAARHAPAAEAADSRRKKSRCRSQRKRWRRKNHRGREPGAGAEKSGRVRRAA